ncbi:ABC transporter ATP-binding protein/permease [Ruminococcus sp. 1001136sp1]|uniref:ABC transporter ATP-binding protein/permease n=1 Tax=unclassified Ruminococcus TaxID=2608920 RepID=UPI00189F1321|nr:ABC transporter ATP-binding protein/permease [Ruminococcus sp. 1001136sp1]MDB8772461.1 ABC transporter ATP-binding protein/permease [Ruminococcus sp. 1001136sp1]MDB8784245.1 ABC transporter ATP-binding protein/permease [Ruminococcus sp. 1001136sp1]
MLQIKDIHKEYRTGNLVQRALDGVSLSLRDNEFVAILGPSGSGKTTLLNIIGGLDRYDRGDLIINGISTKKYKDRDWDSYRNHTIGFVFQSYNLIPHQTVLANVELALTISGVSKSERRRRAKEALEKVGLGAQIHKKPSQMSGGQMQRVAIARALVNDPEILLADEPTGALDSDTSVQVMDLLQEVAKERLVVMVTHNPELAQLYATRIVTVKDGRLLSDTDPFVIDSESMAPPVHKNMGKSSMSFFTALSLSFQNLKTKKARTLLTSFAGSIGIIGIALILSISNGVDKYITNMEEETLSEYPLQIQSTGVDLTSMMMGAATAQSGKKDGEVGVAQMVTNMFSKMNSNDLESLKVYLDSNESSISQYANSVEYTYSVSPQIFLENGKNIRQVNPDKSFSAMGLGSGSSNSIMSSTMSTDVFHEMPEDADLYKDQYDVKAGRWPENYKECVLVLTSQGDISDFLQYTLGLRDGKELDDMVQKFMAEEAVETPENEGPYTYDEILGKKFKLVNSTDYYEYDEEYKVWKDKSDNSSYMKKLVKNGEDLTIVGIVQPVEGATASMLTAGICYTPELTKHVIEKAASSEIVKQQLADEKINVFTGEEFGKEDNENSKFDMESLFSINADALQEAFQVDLSGFNMDLSSLSGLSSGLNVEMPDMPDMSALAGNINLDESSMPDLSKLIKLDDLDLDLSHMIDPEEILKNLPADQVPDMSQALKSVKFDFTEEKVTALLKEVLTGYQESIKDKPEADMDKMQAALKQYLTSKEMNERLCKDLQELVKNNVNVDMSSEKLIAVAVGLMNQYQEYAKANGITQTDVASILAFLSQGEIQQQIKEEAENLVKNSVTVNITTKQIRDLLMQDVVAAYPEYARNNSLPDPANLGTYFLEYMQTEDGQNRLMNGLMTLVDTSEVQTQFSQAMEIYMKSMMTSFTDAIAKGIESKFTEIMEQVEKQLTKGIQTAMEQMIGNISSGMQEAMQSVMTSVSSSLTSAMSQAMSGLGGLGSGMGNMEDALSINPEAFAKAIQMNMNEDDLSELMMSLLSSENSSYDGNLKKLGYADLNVPGGINIYPKDFESKSEIVGILDQYNADMEAAGEDEKVITYTDLVGTLMSSVTNIVNIISYVLVAFVAISLVVSSIMIGVITYISVLERKKEIGILRAIGASRHNVSQVFNAETFIIGFCAGAMGIGITLLLLIPANSIIRSLADGVNVKAALPPVAAVVLIGLSVVLTLLGGLIPSRKAAKSDPVTALRTD